MRRAGPAEAGRGTSTRPFSDCDREQRMYDLIQGAKLMRSNAQWDIEQFLMDHVPAERHAEFRKLLEEWAGAVLIVGSIK